MENSSGNVAPDSWAFLIMNLTLRCLAIKLSCVQFQLGRCNY